MASWTPKVEFNADSFECSGRQNVEYALEVIERETENEPPGKLPRIRLENAAATLRELLNPAGHYYS